MAVALPLHESEWLLKKSFFWGKLFSTETRNVPYSLWGDCMQIKQGGLSTLFLGKDNFFGHSGSTGVFAFYLPNKYLFFIGDFNQTVAASLPIRFVTQLAMFVP